MTKKRELIEVDPEIKKLVRNIKDEFDFGSDRRATKEIAKMFQKKKKTRLIL